MSTILGIEKLKDFLTPYQIDKLNSAGDRHATASNMTFTLLSATETALEVEVAQSETKSGKYASEATLSSRSQALFGKFLPNSPLRINPVAYTPSAPSVVTTAWLDHKMQQKGVRIKQIALETGIDRETTSDWVTGKRSMSHLVKAMFYFYLIK